MAADEITFFLRQLPADVDSARLSLNLGSANVLEYWELRMQNTINMLHLLEGSLNVFLINRVDITTLHSLQQETQKLHQSIRNALMELPEKETSMGRPRKPVLRDEIIELFQIFRNWKIVSRQLGVSSKTLLRRRTEYGIEVSSNAGPRVTYSNISHHDLCNQVQDILDILPEAGETMVIGALRSRNIHIQRRRIREAINEVDPLGRALRRTVAVVRRVYNVPSPNSLW